MDEWLNALQEMSEGRGAGKPLASLLGGVLGGEDEGDAADPGSGVAAFGGIAESGGVTPDVIRSVLALLTGQPAAGAADKRSPAALDGLEEILKPARGALEVDEVALRASDLPKTLAAGAGLGLEQAIRLLQQVLPSLAALLGVPAAKPAQQRSRKPRSAAAVKRAKKTRAGAGAGSASRSKPSTGAAKSRAGSAAKTKPKAGAAPRRKPATGPAKPPAKSRRPSKKVGQADESALDSVLDHA